MIDPDAIPRDPVAIRRGIEQARALIRDPAYRPLRRRLLTLVVHLEAIAMALEAENPAGESAQVLPSRLQKE